MVVVTIDRIDEVDEDDDPYWVIRIDEVDEGCSLVLFILLLLFQSESTKSMRLISFEST